MKLKVCTYLFIIKTLKKDYGVPLVRQWPIPGQQGRRNNNYYE